MPPPPAAGAGAVSSHTNPPPPPADVPRALTSNATSGVIASIGTGSPNLLLYTAPSGAAPPQPPPSVTDQPPHASFTYGCLRGQCNFDAGGSTDDHGIVSYGWSFGDGSPTA